MAFLVKSPITVIAGMGIPIPIATWVHDEYLTYLTLLRTPYPHREPKIRPVADRDRVFLSTWNSGELHQSDRPSTKARQFIKHLSPFFKIFWCICDWIKSL